MHHLCKHCCDVLHTVLPSHVVGLRATAPWPPCHPSCAAPCHSSCAPPCLVRWLAVGLECYDNTRKATSAFRQQADNPFWK